MDNQFKCTSCDFDLSPDWNFCPQCGEGEINQVIQLIDGRIGYVQQHYCKGMAGEPVTYHTLEVDGVQVECLHNMVDSDHYQLIPSDQRQLKELLVQTANLNYYSAISYVI